MRFAIPIAAILTICLAADAEIITSGPQHTVVLVEAGEPVATVVVPEDADSDLIRAAREIAASSEKLCGVPLPVRNDGAAVEGTAVYLGQCEPSLPADLPQIPGRLLSERREAFALRVRDGSIFLAGRTPASVRYAALAFVEQHMGIRWFAPGELWEHVPEGQQGELSVHVADTTVIPDRPLRILSGHRWYDSWSTWIWRNRASSESTPVRGDKSTRMHAAFPVDEYGDTHPEYYPLIDGERYIPEPGELDRHERFWPCTSNPEVVQVMANYIRQWFAERPQTLSFSMALDDVTKVCECDDCRALDPPGAFDRREFSDRYYSFVNAVAREISRTHPDRYLGVLIYRQFRQPPRTVPRIESNVYGFITQNCATWWDPEAEAADRKLTREWAERLEQPLVRYEYYGLGTFTPRFYPHSLDRQMKFDTRMGFEGQYTEMYTFLPHTAPMIWAFSKLMWDSSLEIDALLDEFYECMFGEASETMAEYYSLLERAWNAPRPGRESAMLAVNRNVAQQCLAISPEQIWQGLRLLDRAEEQAGDPRVVERIEIVRAALRYSQLGIESYLLNDRIRSRRVTDRGDAAATLADLAQYGELVRKREAFWSEAHRRDDLLGETLRGLGDRQHYLMTDTFGQIDSTVTGPAMDVVDWYRSNAPADLPRVREALAEMSLPSSVATAVSAYIRARDSENLLQNADLRATEEGPADGLAQADWSAEGAPDHWSVWLRPRPSERNLSRTWVAPSAGQDGSAGAIFEGGQGGSFIQTLPAQPGQKFLVTVWVRGEAGPDARRAGLTDADAAVQSCLLVRFRDAEGLIPPPDKREVQSQVSGVPVEGWQRLALYVEAPENAEAICVMLSVTPSEDALADGLRIIFDNPTLQLLSER